MPLKAGLISKEDISLSGPLFTSIILSSTAIHVSRDQHLLETLALKVGSGGPGSEDTDSSGSQQIPWNKKVVKSEPLPDGRNVGELNTSGLFNGQHT